MIKGRGFLANAIKKIDTDQYLFYVNGISNSVIPEIPEDNFEASEIKELAKAFPDKVLVYVSSCQVNSEQNHQRPYVHHKFKIENLVKGLFTDYLVVRTSNLVGHNPWNTHTLFNFLNHSLTAQSEISVDEQAVRNVLDVDHFVTLLDFFLQNNFGRNATIDIINPLSYQMSQVLDAFEKSRLKTFKKVSSNLPVALFEADPALSVELAAHCDISFDNYLHFLIDKYYS